MNRFTCRFVAGTVAALALVATNVPTQAATNDRPHEIYPLEDPNVFRMDYDNLDDKIVLNGDRRYSDGYMQCEAEIFYGKGTKHNIWFNVAKSNESIGVACPNWIRGVDFDGNGRFNPIFGWIGSEKYKSPRVDETLEVAIYPTDRKTFVMNYQWRPYAPEVGSAIYLFFMDLDGDGRTDMVTDSATDTSGYHNQMFTGTDGVPDSAPGRGVLGFSIFGDFDRTRKGVEYYNFLDSHDDARPGVVMQFRRPKGTPNRELVLPGKFEWAWVEENGDELTLHVKTKQRAFKFLILNDGRLF